MLSLTTSKVNEARAMRVAEVMNGFHILQRGISEIQVNPSLDGSYEQGYQILHQCRIEGQAVLAAEYIPDLLHAPGAPGEKEKQQLQRYEAIPFLWGEGG